MGSRQFSMSALVESVSRRSYAIAGLATAVSLGLASPAAAISWDDAGNSASKLWTDFGNWSPDGSPAGEPVFIGNFVNAQNDTTILDQAFTIDSLSLTNGADVITSTDNGATNDFQLTVTGLTTISGAGSTFFVIGADGDGLDTTGLTINSGGTLNLNSTTPQGTAVLAIRGGASTIQNNDGGTIIGTGRIDFDFNQASQTSVFVNEGTITANTPAAFFGAPAAGTLRINDVGDAEARFDWDGLAPITSVININGNQTLDVDISTGTDAWSGDMNLFTGSTLDMRDSWSMDSGTIDANTAAFGLIIIGQDPNPGAPATITGANWTMTGGTITVDDTWDSLVLDSQLTASGGTIDNEGHLIFNSGATIQSGVDFNMVGPGARITVNGAAVNIDTPDFNLDAGLTTDNVTTINNGGILDLDLGAGADEVFDHDFVFNNGGELDVTTSDNTWGLGNSGTMTANGGGTVNINGEALTLFGDVTVNDGGFFNINAVTTTSGSTAVLVNSGRVNFGSVTYNGGSYNGAGELFMGSKTIASATTINVATTILDDGTSTINADLTINADAITTGNPATDGIDSIHTIADTATLTINLSGGQSYRLDNTLNYNGNAVQDTFLAGSDMILIGTMNVNGAGATSAVLDIRGTVNVTNAADGLRLLGGNATTDPNVINGGTINGDGEIRSSSGFALRGNGTINADIDFDGSSQLIAENGLLDLNGSIVDVGTIGTVTGGVLDSVAWNTQVSNTVRLDGGRIQGGTITNDEVSGIEGEGLVTARVINNTRFDADSGGTLEVSNSTNDWDGTTNTGILNAFGAGSVLEAVDNNAFLFQGTASATSGATVFANGFELEFEPGSTIALSNGGTYRSTNATDIGGTVTSSGSQNRLNISGTADFESTSSTTLNSNLLLDNTATNIQSGATFAGAGRLINAPGRTTRLLNNADVGVLVENRGNFELGSGSSIARGDVADYVQTATGTTSIDIAGNGLGQFDRLFANGNAQLAGEIDLTLTGGYVPALLDSVTVINSAGLIGTFDTVGGVLYAPSRALAVTYTATSVQVTATLPGDTDLDGDVDDTDLGVSISNFTGPGGSGNTWVNGDVDGDGDIDDTDLGLSISNFTGPLAVPVPEPSAAMMLGLAALALHRRRRRA